VNQFEADLRGRFILVPVDGRLVQRGMSLVHRYRLRPYDAVELAAAVRARARHPRSGSQGPRFVSADAALNAAALAEGFTVDDPSHHP
jgi:hypothetical protein